MSIIRRNIPNLFTAGNLVGGILAIMFTLQGEMALAPYCILISAFFDFVDGFMARLLKVDGPLGKQLDSLADMVTFGVAPGLILVKCMENAYHTSFKEAPEYMLYLPLIVPVFAMFRLAKFNIDDKQSEGFIGLPTPAMTIFVAAIPLIMKDCLTDLNSWKFEFFVTYFRNPALIGLIAVVLAVLMVVPLRLFALKFKSFGWKGNEIRYIFLTISLGLLATLFWWALPIIIVLYIILSLVNNLISKAATNEIQS